MYSYPQYAANATEAIPSPGKVALNRLNLVKGPLYRHASLSPSQPLFIYPYAPMSRSTHALAHGSLAACLLGDDAAAANALASKPVRLALGALRTLEMILA